MQNEKNAGIPEDVKTCEYCTECREHRESCVVNREFQGCVQNVKDARNERIVNNEKDAEDAKDEMDERMKSTVKIHKDTLVFAAPSGNKTKVALSNGNEARKTDSRSQRFPTRCLVAMWASTPPTLSNVNGCQQRSPMSTLHRMFRVATASALRENSLQCLACRQCLDSPQCVECPRCPGGSALPRALAVSRLPKGSTMPAV